VSAVCCPADVLLAVCGAGGSGLRGVRSVSEASAAEPITPRTPRPVARPLLVQEWRSASFIHWEADPARVAALLPAGTRPDTLGGTTFVGLVPFRMRRMRLPLEPGVPCLRTFNETNVRLYSVDGAGRRGVVFRSLDAARLLPALIGRLGVRLPYVWSGVRLARDGDTRIYSCRRRIGATAVTSHAVVHVGDPVARPSRLEHFLTARWGIHVRWYSRTLYLPSEHPSWSLFRAELTEIDDGLIGAAGLPQPSGPPVSVLYSPGVPVRFGCPLTVHGVAA